MNPLQCAILISFCVLSLLTLFIGCQEQELRAIVLGESTVWMIYENNSADVNSFLFTIPSDKKITIRDILNGKVQRTELKVKMQLDGNTISNKSQPAFKMDLINGWKIKVDPQSHPSDLAFELNTQGITRKAVSVTPSFQNYGFEFKTPKGQNVKFDCTLRDMYLRQDFDFSSLTPEDSLFTFNHKEYVVFVELKAKYQIHLVLHKDLIAGLGIQNKVIGGSVAAIVIIGLGYFFLFRSKATPEVPKQKTKADKKKGGKKGLPTKNSNAKSSKSSTKKIFD